MRCIYPTQQRTTAAAVTSPRAPKPFYLMFFVVIVLQVLERCGVAQAVRAAEAAEGQTGAVSDLVSVGACRSLTYPVRAPRSSKSSS